MADLKCGQQHTIAATAEGDLYITGYPEIDAESCICFEANGTRYQKYGITDGSILYCSRTAKVNDQDLVVVFEKRGKPALYWFCEDKNAIAVDDVRILHDRSRIYAKVLGAFNFYQ